MNGALAPMATTTNRLKLFRDIAGHGLTDWIWGPVPCNHQGRSGALDYSLLGPGQRAKHS